MRNGDAFSNPRRRVRIKNLLRDKHLSTAQADVLRVLGLRDISLAAVQYLRQGDLTPVEAAFVDHLMFEGYELDEALSLAPQITAQTKADGGVLTKSTLDGGLRGLRDRRNIPLGTVKRGRPISGGLPGLGKRR